MYFIFLSIAGQLWLYSTLSLLKDSWSSKPSGTMTLDGVDKGKRKYAKQVFILKGWFRGATHHPVHISLAQTSHMAKFVQQDGDLTSFHKEAL